jgi:hypothetical protein
VREAQNRGLLYSQIKRKNRLEADFATILKTKPANDAPAPRA